MAPLLTRFARPPAAVVRHVVGVVVGVLLLAVLGACTGDEATAPRPVATPTRTPSPAVTGAGTTLAPKPVPLTVRVTRVAGTLDKPLRHALEHTVRRTISRYVDTALLSLPGPKPSKSYYTRAFHGFTPGAARTARRDRQLLTNAGLDLPIESLTEKRSSAHLAVLAPNEVAAGVTARLRVVYVANRERKRDTRVTVTGRLLLTRAGPGHWRIFGYDVARSTHPVGKEPR